MKRLTAIWRAVARNSLRAPIGPLLPGPGVFVPRLLDYVIEPLADRAEICEL